MSHPEKNCCSDSNRILFERLSEKLGLSVNELKDLAGQGSELIPTISAQRCSWIYKRSTKEYKAGDRCQKFCSEGKVFCKKHHSQAGSNSGFIIDGKTTTTNKYIPEVGIAEIKRVGGQTVTTTVSLLQGDFEKFSSVLTSGKYLE